MTENEEKKNEPKPMDGAILPDGSAFFVASFPLPKDHWIYNPEHDEPPMRALVGISPERTERAEVIREAARWAIRAATMKGTEMDFDPDALVQNMVIALLGYWSEDGTRGHV